ncbi:MAG TPA: patatin-like phospholipase family protein [Solirubrobacterales bacterium]|nr:patatin-like phospholipase family protein [Solirubrobacterales bacterium]
MTAPGTGRRRGIAFGGGGEWFVAWTLSFLSAARRQGVDLGDADVTIGSSAGSLVGAFLTNERLWRGTSEMDFLASHPTLLAHMVKTSKGSPSQQRAADLLAGATSTDRETIVKIGRAAMASRNPPVDAYERSLRLMLGHGDWPSPAHHVTAVDCYTGERVVVDHETDVPIATACAASSSLPGVNGPVWIGDRLCMDGGVSTSSTHADLLTGVERAVVFSMMSLTAEQAAGRSGGFGFAERIHPGTAREEADALTAAGAKTVLVAANPDPGTDFMDPNQLAAAIEDGAARANSMLEDVAAVWH